MSDTHVTFDQLSTANKVGLDNFFATSHSVATCFERLVDLSFSTSRQFLTEVQATANTAINLKDPKEVLSFQSSAMQPSFEKTVNYSRQVYGILADGQSAVRKSFEDYSGRLQKETLSAVDKAFQGAPAGSETVVAAFKSAVTAASSAVDSSTRAFKQSLDVLEGNLTNAAKTMTEGEVVATIHPQQAKK